MSVLSFEKQSSIESKSLMSVWWNGVFFPAIPFHFLECLSNSRGVVKVMLPKVLKEKKYQCNEERSHCIRYFIWGSSSREDFPPCLMHTQVPKPARYQYRTTWHRERLTTSFGGKTQEELEVGLQGKSEYIKKLRLCVFRAVQWKYNARHKCEPHM